MSGSRGNGGTCTAASTSTARLSTCTSPPDETLTLRRGSSPGPTGRQPAEVVTDKASTYPAVLDEMLPGAFHNTAKYDNNAVENDHGRLKARLRPMRGLKQDRSARIVIPGHALIQNIRRGHYELGVESAPRLRLAAAFDELAMAI
jgi:IS6 family transposase